jgi:hypothetical protein
MRGAAKKLYRKKIQRFDATKQPACPAERWMQKPTEIGSKALFAIFAMTKSQF